MEYKSYITDLHLNLHPDQIDLLEKWYEHCRKVSDFFTIAYYPYHMVSLKNGFRTEEEIDLKEMEAQWETIKSFLKKKNVEDDFISFLGYEWQGAGLDGDHNIYFKEDEGRIVLAERYEELVKVFKRQQVIGIPHHLAYSLGNRGKDWETHDEKFSPFVEIYSHHGSSECDQTNLSMERHIHMGPRVDGCTVMDGLKKGYHFGIIASGDNHDIPALVKNGRAGVWAESYTKDGIWDAFINHRTFGFTDSKIIVWTDVQGQPMGSVVPIKEGDPQLHVKIKANGCVERIELYKDTVLEKIKLIKCNEKQMTSNDVVRFKYKLECGWGPNVKFFPNIFEKNWQGTLKTTGKIVSVEPVFNSFENSFDISEDEQIVSFSCKSQKAYGEDHWMRDNTMKNEGYIFEIEANISSEIILCLEGKKVIYTVKEILEKSHLIVYEEEAKSLVRKLSGLDEFPRSDGWYHNAYKAKLYQGFTNSDYEIDTYFELTAPENGEISYFVKIIQCDGQVAWSSPIWLKKE